MKFMPALLLPLSLLAACSSVEEFAGTEPIVDMKGVNVARYESDLSDCRSYADEVDIAAKTASSAAVGAVAGGVIGAAVGNSGTAQRAAGVGAASGTLRGAGEGVRERRMVIRNCLTGRGYAVLN